MVSSAVAAARLFAEEIGAVVWEDIPIGGPKVVWPGSDIEAFFEKVRSLRPQIVYVAEGGDLIAIAIAGVIHIFVPEREGSRNGYGHLGTAMPLRLDPKHDVVDDDDDDDLPEELQDLASRIAADFRFNGSYPEELLDEAGIDGDERTYVRVWMAAARIYDEGVGAQLELEALPIIRELAGHPDFDPLDVDFREGESHPYVDAAILGKDFRLLGIVHAGLREFAWRNGRFEDAVREVKAQATQLLDIIPRLVLDQVGFSSRNATRDALLEPYLESFTARRRELIGHWVKNLDAERGLGRRLDVRYAAAAQRLMVGVATKTATAKTLRVSTGILDRLLRTHVPENFEFDDKDPIVVELAPGIGR